MPGRAKCCEERTEQDERREDGRASPLAAIQEELAPGDGVREERRV